MKRRSLIENLQNENRELKAQLYAARRLQYDAQAGLARYMREHGLADRIGYDVTEDPFMAQFKPPESS